jgi:propanol-preferring alcohol dehydrogenase
MSDTMEAWRIHEWGGVPVFEEMARPEPAPGEVLVAVEACGIGLTVLNYMGGNMANDPALMPRVPGHEYVGRVVAVGEGVDSSLEGTRVLAYFYLSCGECDLCASGSESRCRRLAGRIGIHRDGGYAPYATMPAFNAIPVSEDLPAHHATVIPDAVATPVHVSARAGIAAGDRAVVIGAGGGVGIHMVQVAALHGAEVVGVERTADKLEAIEGLGVAAVQVDDISSLDASRLVGGSPPTVVVDFVGTKETLEWSLSALDTGGRMVVVTTFPDRSMDLNPRDMVRREATLLGSRYASRAQVAHAADLVAKGAVRPMVGRVVEAPLVPEVHADIRAGALLGRGAVVWS